MRDFDYIAAWNEVANPAAEALFAEHPLLRAVYGYVVAYAGDLRQLPSLDMPWPAPTKDTRALGDGLAAHLVGCAEDAIRADTGRCLLQQTLWDVPMVVLSLAARAVYFQGHWAHGAHAQLAARGGAYWKFANYADQVLSERLGLPRDRGLVAVKRGLSFAVHEGFLRAQLDVPGTWMSLDVGMATPEMLKAVRAIERAHPIAALVTPGAARSDTLGERDRMAHAQWEAWLQSVLFALETLADKTVPAPWRNVVATYTRDTRETGKGRER